MTDVFDAGKADFSPLTDKADAIFLSQAKHAARVTIDEEGVVAAAYTVMVACGAALPPDERVEFTLDRPFPLRRHRRERRDPLRGDREHAGMTGQRPILKL